MRGRQEPQVTMLAFVDLEERVPADHPLRTIKALADEALTRLSPEFDRMYADVGRPSMWPRELPAPRPGDVLPHEAEERRTCASCGASSPSDSGGDRRCRRPCHIEASSLCRRTSCRRFCMDTEQQSLPLNLLQCRVPEHLHSRPGKRVSMKSIAPRALGQGLCEVLPRQFKMRASERGVLSSRKTREEAEHPIDWRIVSCPSVEATHPSRRSTGSFVRWAKRHIPIALGRQPLKEPLVVLQGVVHIVGNHEHRVYDPVRPFLASKDDQ